MQTAEAALTAIQRLGQKGLPLERVYRLLFNPELYMTAYGRLARNAGALTPGSTPETVDGMSRVKVEAIIEELRHEQFRWTPVRRTYIEKKNSTKKRPLGLPTWTDKLVQEVIRLILDTYYEPQFSPHSHGFRAGRGCHTALSEVYYNWRGTTWFIEGDISGCFDSLNHDVLIELLSERIKDGRFLRLICGLLDAGYLEEWKHHATLSGAPQGSVVSPLLANVYLNELDRFVERTLVPAYNRGDRRKDNRAYQALHTRIRYWEKRSGWDRVKALREEYRRTPSKDPDDPAYRRLKYVRYADDFLLGFCGPKAEAEEVKQQLTAFLRERLKLQLSEQKTLITHARTGAARFLGYEVTILDADDQRDAKGNRNINGQVGLRVPADVIRDKGIPYRRGGKPMRRPELTSNDAYSIVAQYQAEYRGVVEYYRMAFNLHRMAALKRTMEISLSKTLASKLRCSCNAVWCRYGAVAEIHGKRYRVLEISVPREGKAALVAKWGGISLKFRTKGVTLDDAPSRVWNRRSEIVERLLAGTCERCGSQEDVQVHHVRKLADLAKPGRRTAPEWARLMSARRRKTLVVCRKCHEGIHAGVGSGKAEGHRRAV
jgi:group II intron reverse transcriptase/maturase